MKKRQKHILNYRFQMKILFSVLILISLFFSLTVFMVHRNLRQNQQLSATVVKELNETVTNEDNVIKAFIKFTNSLISRYYELKTDTILKDHQKSIDQINTSISKIDDINKNSVFLLRVIITAFILQVVILIIFLIRLTHKIYGPIHVMDKMMHEMLKGKTPTVRKLRKNDEFQRFYETFVKVIEKEEKKREK